VSQPFAIVRDGRELLAAGPSLDEAMALAAKSFYGPGLPPTLEILQEGCDPLPSLAAVPCSELLLASSDSEFGPDDMSVLHGVLCLESEASSADPDQLPLF